MEIETAVHDAHKAQQRGEFDKAQEALEAIPGPDRAGDLAAVPYILAECVLRQTPTKATEPAPR